MSFIKRLKDRGHRRESTEVSQAKHDDSLRGGAVLSSLSSTTSQVSELRSPPKKEDTKDSPEPHVPPLSPPGVGMRIPTANMGERVHKPRQPLTASPTSETLRTQPGHVTETLGPPPAPDQAPSEKLWNDA